MLPSMPALPPRRPASAFYASDLLVLGGAALIVPLALWQRRWLLLTVGFALVLVVVGRIALTQWLAKRYPKR
jgi:hypothetical protein